jgi:CysZ protein
MISAAFKALSDLTAPEFRSILWKAVGLALLLFIAVFALVQALFWLFAQFPWPWLEAVAAVGAGVGLLVLFFFIMAPVTALFAGLYLDDVAAKVEAKHYPKDAPGRPQPFLKAALYGVQFGLMVLVINILALPLVFTGVGAIALVVINAYLLSREYFELAALRTMDREDAKALRRDHGVAVFVAGFLPAVMALVPIVNLTVPIFATSYFVHLFKQLKGSSA